MQVMPEILLRQRRRKELSLRSWRELIQNPGFAAVEQPAEHEGFVHPHLGSSDRHMLPQTLFSRRASAVAALPISLFSPAIRKRLPGAADVLAKGVCLLETYV